MVYQSSTVSVTAFQSLPTPSSSRFHHHPASLPAVHNAPSITKSSPLCNLFASRDKRGRRQQLPFLRAKKLPREEEEDELDFIDERVESLEDILEELEAFGADTDDDDDDEFFLEEWDEDSLEKLFQSLPDEVEDEKGESDDMEASNRRQEQSAFLLETALLQGVVAPSAGVGSNCLPGDFDFDPLDLASKDYFPQAQAFVGMFFPSSLEEDEEEIGNLGPRPKALILRDYREAEIRHGRLAMLAATFWPLQELLDRLVLDDGKFNSLVNSLLFGGVTLPYFPLLMTAIMLLLGYLDIYSQTVKGVDKVGDAFLPGDCFWDPLRILTGTSDLTKRNMQERELFNGRVAMLAVAVFVYEEARTGQPVISIPGNDILFEPAYQVPFVQKWLDTKFSSPSPVFYPLSEDMSSAATSFDLVFLKMNEVLTLNL